MAWTEPPKPPGWKYWQETNQETRLKKLGSRSRRRRDTVAVQGLAYWAGGVFGLALVGVALMALIVSTIVFGPFLIMIVWGMLWHALHHRWVVGIVGVWILFYVVAALIWPRKKYQPPKPRHERMYP